MKPSEHGRAFLVLLVAASWPVNQAAAALRRQPKYPHAWFGVVSSPLNHQRRLVIRSTWMQDPWAQASTVKFVLGKSNLALENVAVMKESKQYGDILHVNMQESYKGLVWKVALLLQEAVKSKADWIIKVDDDVVPRMQDLADILSKNMFRRYRYAGHMIEQAPVIRDPRHKWYVAPSMFAEEVFPKYAEGPWYAVSRDLAQRIAIDRFNETWQNPVELENVTVGAAVLTVDTDENSAVQYIDIEATAKGCYVGVWSPWYHGMGTEEMKCMWKRLHQYPPVDACCPEYQATQNEQGTQ